MGKKMFQTINCPIPTVVQPSLSAVLPVMIRGCFPMFEKGLTCVATFGQLRLCHKKLATQSFQEKCWNTSSHC